MKKLRAVLRWTGRAPLVLLAIPALFILEENIRGRIQLARYKAELRANGEKLTLAELNLPVPSKEGGGNVELIAAGQELNDLQRSNRFSVWYATRLLWNGPDRPVVRCQQTDLGVRRLDVPLRTGGRGRRPVKDMTETNSNELAEQGVATNQPLQASWADLAAEVDAASNALARVGSALTRSVVAFPIDYSQGFDARLPHWKEMQNIPTWLALAGLHELHANDLDAAIQNISLLTALTRIDQDGRFVAVQHRRISTGERGLDLTWEALQAPGWNDSQLARLQEIWQMDNGLPETILALETERGLNVTYIEKVRGSFAEWQKLRRSLLSTAQCGYADLRNDIAVSLYVTLWRVTWMDQDELLLLKQYQHILEATRKVMDGQAWQNVYHPPPQIPSFLYYGELSPYFCAQFFQPSVESTALRAMQFETRRQMTLTVIALKRYDLRHGHLPADLRELVPELLTEPPRDYMTDQPLRYHLGADGTFRLYSVGNDGRDDGGDTNPTQGKRLITIWDGRDAVWPQSASKR